MRLILASQSPARLGVLRAAGVDPIVEVSGVDEDRLTEQLGDASPTELVRALAEAKATEVATRLAPHHPDAVVVGCDSMLHTKTAQGVALEGKPHTAEVAARRWDRIAGNTGELLTGHCVIKLENGAVAAQASDTETTVVRFSEPSRAEIDAYIATGEPLSVAGAFTLDGLGGWFVDGIDGDPSSVIGISLPLTRKLLADLGVSVVDLWR